jgi:trehalose utilization protein
VTVWGENIHEQKSDAVRAIYPDGMHTAIGRGIEQHLGTAVTVRTATLDEPEHGLSEETLANTDVLTWWGHKAHHAVADEIVDRVEQRVLDGMGLIVLHSSHWSKIFKRLMGTRCSLRWREDDDREVVWTVAPSHRIARGVAPAFILEQHEMYGEFFDIPVPDELVFISNYSGGEVFRSGCCFHRGKGRVFYFSPGHETHPIYHHPEVKKVLGNAVAWAYQPAPSPIDTKIAPHSPRGWFENLTENEEPRHG